MIIKTKYKLCRRLGASIFEKCQTHKFTLSEARKSGIKRLKRRKILSEYALQLLEKQKLRFAYGIGEKQLARYVKETTAKKDAAPAETLYLRLETRLDNVVYRLGLAPTRAMARQLVSHGHILLNGKKVSIPSCQIKMGDRITIRKKSADKAVFADLKDKVKNALSLDWLNFNLQKKEGIMTGYPKLDGREIFDFKSIFEFYSR